MNRSVVTMALTEQRFRQYKVPDAYKFDPHGRWAWFQKLAWKLLQRTKALRNAYEDRAVYKTVSIDGDDLITKIMKAHMYAFTSLGMKPTEVLLGRKEFCELTSLTDNMRFPVTVPSYAARYDGTVCGLPIRIVPHMEGVLVL